MKKAGRPPQRLSTGVFFAAAGLHLCLLGLFLGRFVPAIGFVGAAVLTVPLLIPVAAYLTNPRKAYQWLCVVVIPYLGLAIAELVANPDRRQWATMFALVLLGQFVVAAAGTRVSPNSPRQSGRTGS